MRTRHRKGMTLVEILLAMLVMIIGIVGIVVLFPMAIERGKETAESSLAGNLIGSLRDSLLSGFATAKYDSKGTPSPDDDEFTVYLSHDLKTVEAAGGKYYFAFKLPKVTEGWKHFPSGGSSDPDDGIPVPFDDTKLASKEWTDWIVANDNFVFNLGSDPWLKEIVKLVHETNDPSDPYAQYSFAFDIRYVPANEIYYSIPASIAGYNKDDVNKYKQLNVACLMYSAYSKILEYDVVNYNPVTGIYYYRNDVLKIYPPLEKERPPYCLTGAPNHSVAFAAATEQYNDDITINSIQMTRGYAYDVVLYVFRGYPATIFGGLKRSLIHTIAFRAISQPYKK
jgi:type II secretory pathway pseudopilin PulG